MQVIIMHAMPFLLKRQIREIETEFLDHRRPWYFNGRFLNANGWETGVFFDIKGLLHSAIWFTTLLVQHFPAFLSPGRLSRVSQRGARQPFQAA
jgi:hypothetical protein